MTDIFNMFRARVDEALDGLSAAGVVAPDAPRHRITVESPRDPSHGDVSTNAAMVLAGSATLPPKELAAALAERLTGTEGLEKVSSAGAGFVNASLTAAVWRGLLPGILKAGADYGSSTGGVGEKVNVEYVSANPTGPLHVGHTRGAVFGDALSRLLERAGYEVTREYYVNDGGAQVDDLGRSAFLRYREALGEKIGKIPEGMYPGDYLKAVGESLAKTHGRALLKKEESAWLPVARAAAIEAMTEGIRADLTALGISQDVFFSEKSLHDGRLDEMMASLTDRDLAYEGVLEPPRGKESPEWISEEQTLFRASGFGDDSDRVLRKANGDWTYFASDAAYHYDKFRRGFAKMIDVWGSDHAGHIKRMQAAVKALTEGRGELDVKVCRMVRLSRGGEPVKMSKRSGEFVTMREVVDEVGRDAVRFMMLFRRNDAPLDFDFQKVAEQSRDNPVFYVQYAHARICSVLRHADDIDMNSDSADWSRMDFSPLQDVSELGLIRRMSRFPQMVEQAAAAHEPHRIAFYLHDLAADFHGLWNKGKAEDSLRFINPSDRDGTMARLGLIRAVRGVIASGCDILGIRPVEEM